MASRGTAGPARQTAKSALILGLDTAAGAYLARLLNARGYRLGGTGTADLLTGLGIASDVDRHEAIDAALIADVRPDEIYDLRQDTAATAALLDLAGSARLFVVAAPGAIAAEVARARDAGRFAVAGMIFAHESRLGPGTSAVARVVAAVYAGTDPAAADLASVTDCGWTPEYVDAMTRMLQQSRPADFAIASGRAVSGSEVARHASDYFRRDSSRFAAGEGDAAAADTAIRAVGDAAPAAAALGWRAVTWGRDLVRVLCEGVAGT